MKGGEKNVDLQDNYEAFILVYKSLSNFGNVFVDTSLIIFRFL